jgi:hypothetical protein
MGTATLYTPESQGRGNIETFMMTVEEASKSTYTTEIMLASVEANDGHPHINHNVNRHDDLCHFLKHIVLTICLNRMPATFS